MGKPTNAAIVDLNGRAWQPFESTSPTGYVTYTASEGEIHIPYGTDPVSLTIQAHELSHVRYTSKVWPDAKSALARLTTLANTANSIVGYAEDMRITALAGRLGVKTLPVFGNKDDKAIITRWVESFVAAGVPQARVEKAVRFILNEHTTVVERIGLNLHTLQQKKNAEAYITYCAQHLHNLLARDKDDSKSDEKSDEKGDEGDKGTSSESKPRADKSDPMDKSEDKTDKDKSKSDQSDEDEDETSDEGGEGGDEQDDTDEGDSTDDEGEPAEDGDGDSESSSSGGGKQPDEPTEGAGAKSREDDEPEVIDLTDLALPDIRQAMLQSVPAPMDTQKLIQTFQHTLDKSDWIPVKTIERKPLVRRAAQSRNRGRKLSEVGVVLGSAYDAVAPNERRPFVAKRRGGAGGLTVVIDCSGSMHISEKQLEQLLLTHPQGVVVTYSSYVGSYTTDKAVVRLIASHGRLAATDDFRDPMAGGNGCDGPVLEWLAKQSGERVWVCDGMITGHGDQAVFHNPTAREAWLKAHRITRFNSLSEYLNSLTR